MIVKTYQINGMHCMGCVNKVQKAFISHNHISEADVNLKNASVKLQMTSKLQLDELMDVLKNIGDYEMIENESEIHHKKFQLSTYKPLLLVIGFILLVSILSSYKTSFQFMNWMTNFMGGFIIAFSFFKFAYCCIAGVNLLISSTSFNFTVTPIQNMLKNNLFI